MNRKYNLKLDLQFRCNNSTMKFNQFDNNTSDFFMRITNGGNLVDIEKAIVVLAIIKPSGKVASQFVEIENGLVYADLKPNMRDEIGTYTAQAMLILEDERVVTDVIGYEVEEDKIFSLLNDSVGTSEEFTLLTDMLNRLSTIETSEEQRVINEAERILSEENRKIEEAKRVEAELIRQHEEADRAKYDATRESNENIRKQNESIRLANETNRIDEETKRVEEETKRVEAEQLRKDNYNFMTEDEERRRSEANAHKEAEALRVQAETNRVNEEAKRRTTEQARVSAENTRVSNENTREANEVVRKNNETKRVEAETQRQNRYNSFIADAEANANNFENYTNTAKVNEEERKSNELDRKSQEARRVSNEVERISNENTRKANEKAREKNETSRQNIFENKVDEVDKKIIEINATKDNFVSSVNTKVDSKISELDNTKSDMATSINNKVNEVENRFNALTSKQQQDAEVIDARDGETSLKARLDRDIEKAKQVYVNVEGSNISTDSSDGYLKNVEILGNTVQDSENLADIRSVGDTVEGQELYEIPVLSVGKNLFNTVFKDALNNINGVTVNDSGVVTINGTLSTHAMFNVVIPKGKYRTTTFSDSRMALHVFWEGGDSSFQTNKTLSYTEDKTLKCYIASGTYDNHICKFQLEEGTVATPYEPYIEDKLTILSPVQLEKVGDVRDRIIEKDGVWGIEKNVITITLDGTEAGWYNNDTQKFYEVPIADIVTPNTTVICDKYIHTISGTGNETGKIVTVQHSAIRIYPTNYDNTTLSEFKKELNVNNVTIKYPTTQLQFIPLPHSQQVKLRTFASKTNISFGCEIEGTIKAQVPKSLGATVNTHTEQIRSLNNELNRVKKLEESTVSTVETESDFTTVEATSNGYFEDVKLEGKTLVNLAPKYSIKWTHSGTWLSTFLVGTKNPASNHYKIIQDLKPNTEYTVIVNIKTNTQSGNIDLNNYQNNNTCVFKDNMLVKPSDIGIKTFKVKTVESFDNINPSDMVILRSQNWGIASGETLIEDIMILEGDHTQNPPSIFEGLKSVGQSATTSEDGVDEISVESVNENIMDDSDVIVGYLDGSTSTYKDNAITRSLCAKVKPNTTYTIHTPCIANEDYNRNSLGLFSEYPKLGVTFSIPKEGGSIAYVNGINQRTFTTLSDTRYVVFYFTNDINTIGASFKMQLEEGTEATTYTPHQSDKKRLLYYNEETQTWEKPILRQGDSIEKHANGKYYYHQRSGEVVFDGSENWNNDKNSSTMSPATYRQSIQFDAIDIPSASFNTKTSPNIISDLLPTVTFGDVYSHNHIGISISGTDSIGTHIIINNNFIDVTELKQWLQANNLTVVYQLAEEKVYECTNIDLITYNGETNYIVESGVLSPRTTLKVHNNISNVVSLLQKKVSLLESNVKASQEVQDMMILETDMRMLDIELALMEFIPMTLNLGGSNMLRSATYFNFLKNHIINETYEKEYLENVMNKYLATGRINQDEYNELYKMLYPPVYDIELPIEY